MKQYTESDAEKILRRAAELQAASEAPLSGSTGATEDNLLEIAQEAGIDPAFVQQAMLEQDQRATKGQEKWLGAPPEHSIERVVEAPMTPKAWDAIRAALNHTYRQSNAGEQIGDVYTWHHKHELGSVHFSASPVKGGKYRLRLSHYIDDAVSVGLVVTIFAMIASGGAIATLTDFLGAAKAVLAVLTALLVYGVYWRSARSQYSHDKRKIREMMSRIVQSIEEAEAAEPIVEQAAEEVVRLVE